MRHMKHTLIAVLVAVVALPAPLFAVGAKKAQYVGGTIVGLKEKAEGTLDTSTLEAVVFTAKNQPALTIPYARITELEYGQKAGRRVGVAILVSPLALFSKKRKHYLTIGFTDADGQAQAAVFELGKDIIRTSLTIIETRSGQAIVYQDDEARKSGRGE
jgi:hypothetical protein